MLGAALSPGGGQAHAGQARKWQRKKTLQQQREDEEGQLLVEQLCSRMSVVQVKTTDKAEPSSRKADRLESPLAQLVRKRRWIEAAVDSFDRCPKVECDLALTEEKLVQFLEAQEVDRQGVLELQSEEEGYLILRDNVELWQVTREPEQELADYWALPIRELNVGIRANEVKSMDGKVRNRSSLRAGVGQSSGGGADVVLENLDLLPDQRQFLVVRGSSPNSSGSSTTATSSGSDEVALKCTLEQWEEALGHVYDSDHYSHPGSSFDHITADGVVGKQTTSVVGGGGAVVVVGKLKTTTTSIAGAPEVDEQGGVSRNASIGKFGKMKTQSTMRLVKILLDRADEVRAFLAASSIEGSRTNANSLHLAPNGNANVDPNINSPKFSPPGIGAQGPGNSIAPCAVVQTTSTGAAVIPNLPMGASATIIKTMSSRIAAGTGSPRQGNNRKAAGANNANSNRGIGPLSSSILKGDGSPGGASATPTSGTAANLARAAMTTSELNSDEEDDEDMGQGKMGLWGTDLSKILHGVRHAYAALLRLDCFQECTESFIYSLALYCTDLRTYIPGVAHVEVDRTSANGNGAGGVGGAPLVGKQMSALAVSKGGLRTLPTATFGGSAPGQHEDTSSSAAGAGGTTTNNTGHNVGANIEDASLPPSRKIFVRSLFEGAIFGELSLLGIANVRSATITAKQTTDVCIVRRADLNLLLQRFPDAAATLGRLARYRIREFFVAHPQEAKMLRDLGVFKQQCAPEFLDLLQKKVTLKFFGAGDVIVTERSRSDGCMYVIQFGACNVSIRGTTIATLQDGEYTATVTAASICLVHVLSRDSIQEALKVCPSELKIFKNVAGSPTHALRLSQIPFFQDLDPALCNILQETTMDDMLFMPGDVIVQENALADSMLLLQSGNVDVLVNRGHHKVREIAAPPVQTFGEFSLVEGWSSKRTATLKATSVCYAQVLHRSVVKNVLQRDFPTEVRKFETLAAKHLHQLPPSGNLYLDIPLFRDSPSRFLYKLDLFSERCIFYTGDIILSPGGGADEEQALTRDELEEVEVAEELEDEVDDTSADQEVDSGSAVVDHEVTGKKRSSKSKKKESKDKAGAGDDAGAAAGGGGKDTQMPVGKKVSGRRRSADGGFTGSTSTNSPISRHDSIEGGRALGTASIDVGHLSRSRDVARKTIASADEIPDDLAWAQKKSKKPKSRRGGQAQQGGASPSSPGEKTPGNGSAAAPSSPFNTSHQSSFKRPEDFQALFMLLKGEVEVLHGNKVISVLKTGDTFGEIFALGLRRDRVATIRAKTLCDVLSVEKSALDAALAEFPEERTRLEATALERMVEFAVKTGVPLPDEQCATTSMALTNAIQKQKSEARISFNRMASLGGSGSSGDADSAGGPPLLREDEVTMMLGGKAPDHVLQQQMGEGTGGGFGNKQASLMKKQLSFKAMGDEKSTREQKIKDINSAAKAEASDEAPMDEEAEEIARIRKHLQLVNHDPDFDRYPKISRLIDSEFASALERFNAGFVLSRLFVDESGAHLPLPIVSDETKVAESASLVSKHLAEEKEGAASDASVSGTTSTAAAAARKETKDDESSLSEGFKAVEELAESNGMNDETVKKHKSHRRHSTIIAVDEEKTNTENDNASDETVVKKKSSASARAKAGFRNNRKTVTFCAGGSEDEEEPDLDKEDEDVLDSDTIARAPTPFAREEDGEEALNVVVPPPGNFTALQKLSEPLAEIIQNGVAKIHAHLPTSHTLDRPAKHIHNLLGGGATATGGGKKTRMLAGDIILDAILNKSTTEGLTVGTILEQLSTQLSLEEEATYAVRKESEAMKLVPVPAKNENVVVGKGNAVMSSSPADHVGTSPNKLLVFSPMTTAVKETTVTSPGGSFMQDGEQARGPRGKNTTSPNQLLKEHLEKRQIGGRSSGTGATRRCGAGATKIGGSQVKTRKLLENRESERIAKMFHGESPLSRPASPARLAFVRSRNVQKSLLRHEREMREYLIEKGRRGVDLFYYHRSDGGRSRKTEEEKRRRPVSPNSHLAKMLLAHSAANVFMQNPALFGARDIEIVEPEEDVQRQLQQEREDTNDEGHALATKITKNEQKAKVLVGVCPGTNADGKNSLETLLDANWGGFYGTASGAGRGGNIQMIPHRERELMRLLDRERALRLLASRDPPVAQQRSVSAGDVGVGPLDATEVRRENSASRMSRNMAGGGRERTSSSGGAGNNATTRSFGRTASASPSRRRGTTSATTGSKQKANVFHGGLIPTGEKKRGSLRQTEILAAVDAGRAFMLLGKRSKEKAAADRQAAQPSGRGGGASGQQIDHRRSSRGKASDFATQQLLEQLNLPAEVETDEDVNQQLPHIIGTERPEGSLQNQKMMKPTTTTSRSSYDLSNRRASAADMLHGIEFANKMHAKYNGGGGSPAPGPPRGGTVPMSSRKNKNRATTQNLQPLDELMAAPPQFAGSGGALLELDHHNWRQLEEKLLQPEDDARGRAAALLLDGQQLLGLDQNHEEKFMVGSDLLRDEDVGVGEGDVEVEPQPASGKVMKINFSSDAEKKCMQKEQPNLTTPEEILALRRNPAVGFVGAMEASSKNDEDQHQVVHENDKDDDHQHEPALVGHTKSAVARKQDLEYVKKRSEKFSEEEKKMDEASYLLELSKDMMAKTKAPLVELCNGNRNLASLSPKGFRSAIVFNPNLSKDGSIEDGAHLDPAAVDEIEDFITGGGAIHQKQQKKSQGPRMLWKDELQQEAVHRALAKSLGRDPCSGNDGKASSEMKDKRRKKQVTGLGPRGRDGMVTGNEYHLAQKFGGRSEEDNELELFAKTKSERGQIAAGMFRRDSFGTSSLGLLGVKRTTQLAAVQGGGNNDDQEEQEDEGCRDDVIDEANNQKAGDEDRVEDLLHDEGNDLPGRPLILSSSKPGNTDHADNSEHELSCSNSEVKSVLLVDGAAGAPTIGASQKRADATSRKIKNKSSRRASVQQNELPVPRKDEQPGAGSASVRKNGGIKKTDSVEHSLDLSQTSDRAIYKTYSPQKLLRQNSKKREQEEGHALRPHWPVVTTGGSTTMNSNNSGNRKRNAQHKNFCNSSTSIIDTHATEAVIQRDLDTHMQALQRSTEDLQQSCREGHFAGKEELFHTEFSQFAKEKGIGTGVQRGRRGRGADVGAVASSTSGAAGELHLQANGASSSSSSGGFTAVSLLGDELYLEPQYGAGGAHAHLAASANMAAEQAETSSLKVKYTQAQLEQKSAAKRSKFMKMKQRLGTTTDANNLSWFSTEETAEEKFQRNYLKQLKT
eukprot:g2029.t1